MHILIHNTMTLIYGKPFYFLLWNVDIYFII